MTTTRAEGEYSYLTRLDLHEDVWWGHDGPRPCTQWRGIRHPQSREQRACCGILRRQENVGALVLGCW